ncbi:MAG TPA: fasciclin domain-containing protein [Streptosporangiaceae bacterium]|nr:fasciclin domain-containing protein [Streptosporangiaceae bacterium]
MNPRVLVVPVLAAGLVLSAAACSSGSSSSAAAKAAPAQPAAGISASQASASLTDFGPACSSVPSSGPGSFTGMSTAPVATAASANPVLSTLVTAVKKAGLVDTLNSASSITVFAPDNAAFAKLPAATLDKVLADKAELTKILTYHVAAGRLTPAELASGTTIKTLEGGSITPTLTNGTYTVNGAHVICGNVQTANATVYIIDSVLTPPAS